MAKVKKKVEEGAPAWVMTYGDMMSLLLCFFILLAALSELKKEDEYKAIVEVVKKSFGLRGGGGHVHSPTDPVTSLRERLERIELTSTTRSKVSNADDPGMEGRELEVRKVRDGWEFTQGGRITFEPVSAELTNDAKRQLLRIAKELRGKNNMIEIRGHASNLEIERLAGSPFKNLDQLAFARAEAVRDFLADSEGGRIRAIRFRLTSVADREPLVKREYEAEKHEPNRRVSIFARESLVRDVTQPETSG